MPGVVVNDILADPITMTKEASSAKVLLAQFGGHFGAGIKEFKCVLASA